MRMGLRQEIVPDGEPAAWTHFNAQISSWAGRRYLETHDQRYLTIATEYFNRTLSTITGEGEYHSLLNSDGTHHEESVQAFRMPECWTRMKNAEGETFVVASPNVPLNWGVGKLRESTHYYKLLWQKVNQVVYLEVRK